jgi:hypothetical protein
MMDFVIDIEADDAETAPALYVVHHLPRVTPERHRIHVPCWCHPAIENYPDGTVVRHNIVH